MGFPLFSGQSQYRRFAKNLNVAAHCNRLLSARSLSAQACSLVLFASLSACATQLAQLPTAEHERASFNAPRLAERLLGSVPTSLLRPSVTLFSAASGNKNTLASTGTVPIHAGDKSQVETDSNLIPTSDTSLLAAVNSSEELLSINAIAAPIESLLFALASDAGFELHVNGDLNKLVTIKISHQPLPGLLDKLAEQAAFSWAIEGGRITIWTGSAYGYSYPINYLNIDRRTQSSVGLATQVGTINAADSSGSVANSSETRVENLSEHHFWQSLSTDVEGLITQSSLVSENSLSQIPPSSAQFSINREAGLLTLFATPDVHQSLQRYLALLHDSTQRQVLIEATVVEVALSDSFEAGVDWQVLAQGINGFSAAQVLVGAPFVDSSTVDRLTAPSGLLSLVQQGSQNDVRATLSLLEQFGDVRILSRPRIIALNNQSSVLKVVDNRVYFTDIVGYQNDEWSSAENITETSRLQEYFRFMTDGRFPVITISASLLLALGVSIKASRLAETDQAV